MSEPVFTLQQLEFFLVLMELTEPQLQTVVERIMKRWNAEAVSKTVRIDHASERICSENEK